MVPSPYRPNKLISKELEEEFMKYTANKEGNQAYTHPVEQLGRNAGEEVVDIVECSKYAKFGGCETVEAEREDPFLTESSSSFCDSDCGSENDDALGKSEVLSVFHGDPVVAIDSEVFEDIFSTKKKRLTGHWKAYIQPLAWRCRWAELQIKKLEEQARIYDQKLEVCNQQKQPHIEKSTLDVYGVKSLPLSQCYGNNEVLRRNKRRRDEAAVDVATYMSNHNLFSYYEDRKNTFPKAPITNSAHAKKINVYKYCGCDEQSLPRKDGNDDSALEELYRRLTSLQSHVSQLKGRVNKVITEHTGQFSPNENFMLPPAPCNDSDMPPSNTAALPNNAPDRMPAGSNVASQPRLGHDMNNFVVNESAVPRDTAVITGANRRADGDNIRVYRRRGKAKKNTLKGLNAQQPAAESSSNPLAVAQPVPPDDAQPPQVMLGLTLIGRFWGDTKDWSWSLDNRHVWQHKHNKHLRSGADWYSQRLSLALPS